MANHTGIMQPTMDDDLTASEFGYTVVETSCTVYDHYWAGNIWRAFLVYSGAWATCNQWLRTNYLVSICQLGKEERLHLRIKVLTKAILFSYIIKKSHNGNKLMCFEIHLQRHNTLRVSYNYGIVNLSCLIIVTTIETVTPNGLQNWYSDLVTYFGY